MKGDDENMVPRKDVEQAHDKKYIVPSDEVLRKAKKQVLNKHRETLERLAKK